MVAGQIMFCVIIAIVDFPTLPIKVIFSLEGLILEPIKTHIHRYCFPLFDYICDDVPCSCIVCLYGGRRLRMTYFDEDLTNHFGVFSICEDAYDFGFGCRQHHMP